MAKRLKEYVKYTSKELDSYTNTEGSCVKKINTNLHITIGPYALSDFKTALLNHITQTKIGLYNVQLDGIVLDMKNIKVLGHNGSMRFDDSKIHLDINADVYLFRPEIDAELSGVVKHISSKHVGVIIYRVFNATIKFHDALEDNDVEMDKTVTFTINNFNMSNHYPYIEGKLLTKTTTNKSKNNKIKFEDSSKDNTTDSGIEEKDSSELDALISLIKEEPNSECEVSPKKQKKNKVKKRKHDSELSEVIDINHTVTVKSESKKKSKKSKSISILDEEVEIKVEN